MGKQSVRTGTREIERKVSEPISVQDHPASMRFRRGSRSARLREPTSHSYPADSLLSLFAMPAWLDQERAVAFNNNTK